MVGPDLPVAVDAEHVGLAELGIYFDTLFVLLSPGSRLLNHAIGRIWRLYMAGSAVNFEDGNIQVHQVLAAKPDRGSSGMPLRPAF